MKKIKFNDHFSYCVSFSVSFCLVLNGCHTGKIKWEEETGRRVQFSPETHFMIVAKTCLWKLWLKLGCCFLVFLSFSHKELSICMFNTEVETVNWLIVEQGELITFLFGKKCGVWFLKGKKNGCKWMQNYTLNVLAVNTSD